ncbi:unnamed protein product [Euphydryas editha]|uniref:Uncharacterized protein n=1 Tax=Euphydryas editha TaxID=104508 RepID=A0AAU9TW03_EUPED|nr:unnamed protein product [Euphydryas editha]
MIIKLKTVEKLFLRLPSIKTAANLATIIFNNGYVALLDVIAQLLGISIGEKLFNYCHDIDQKRIEDASVLSSKHAGGRLSAINSLQDEDMILLGAKELLYGRGIAE